MKIGIHTHPLKTNYGGLLQAFALQTVLRRLGHEVLTIDRSIKKDHIIIKLISMTKRSLVRFLLNKPVPIRVLPSVKESAIISQHTNRFIKENIPMTGTVNTYEEFESLEKHGFDAYIVGSDQVWRPSMTPGITHYFLDFLENKDGIKRMSYAASFGVANWEFSSRETANCSVLAKKFDGISVREDSGIDLCKKHLGVDVEQHLDPSMLLKKEDYTVLVKRDKIPRHEGNLFTYVLDKSKANEKIISKVAKELGLKPFSVMPKKKFSERTKNNLKDCIFNPVTEWIRGFMDADFIITDSFHGTAFSILFNKQFIAVGNVNRGLTRFQSILRVFNLENRLILSQNDLTKDLLFSKIDFEPVNEILNRERERSLAFLKENLGK